MCQILRSIGFEIVGEATNGEEAVDLYNMYKPQMVTLDFHMPRMNGLTTLQHIKKINKEAVVLMSTSMSNKDTAKELILNGATAYIVKPFERTVLIEKVRQLVANHVLTRG
jgi:two-component system chemotaxis response regulator CheY